MNKDRREQIYAQIKTLKEAMARLAVFKSEAFELPIQKCRDDLDDLDIEGIQQDEQDAFDNLSENLQASDNGTAMGEAIGNLESADGFKREADEMLENMQGAVEELETKLQECIDALESAKGE